VAGPTGPTGAAGSNATANLQTTLYTSGSSTWTAPTGVTKVRVTLFGGGGGGYSGCGEGGNGGFAYGIYTVTPGTGYTVTVGAGGNGKGAGTAQAGGTSSFGALISATGGGAGTVSGFGTSGAGSNGNIRNLTAAALDVISGYLGGFPWGGGRGQNTSNTGVAWSASSYFMAGTYGANDKGGIGGMVLVEWVG
jgi:hypothetical protein